MAPPLYQERTANAHSIPGLDQSSLELDKRSASSTLSPISARDLLTARNAASTYVPGQGTRPASSFNNNFFFILFAIIGTAMVLASLWFFFWAKNGGFHFQEGDWEDYKSTVLRRKGPDGKTLSNATKSTKLGYGASTIAGTQHYKWAVQEARSVVGRDEKGRKGIRAKRGWAKTHSILYSDDYQTPSVGNTETVSDMTELRTEPDYSQHSKRYRDRDVQDYKREKSARVGGLNRIADGNGSKFGTTINGSETQSEASEPMLGRSREQKEKERAQRKAREEAARMERRWKREAEEAAAALARENVPAPPPPAHASRKSAAPSSKPTSGVRQRSASRSASPKKKDRDFSYGTGPASEVLSATYTSTTGESRSASYYDEYRPRAEANPRYESEYTGKSRQSSPKKGAGRKGREGYRRGADSDLD